MTLAVNWGSTLELLRWQQRPKQDSLKASWAAESCSRRTLLLGLGEPLRCLAPIPGGGIVGTVDAPVPLSASGLTGSGGDGAALLSGISESSMSMDDPEGTEGGVLDLRGRFAQQQLSEPGVTVPSAFLLGSAPSTRRAAEQARAQTARVAVVRPSELVQDAAWKPDQASAVNPAFVMPLGLPMPDILRTTAAPLVAVASSSGPPVVQLFVVKHEGLEPVSNVLLTLDHPRSMPAPPGSLPPPDSVSLRLRGLHVSSELKDADGGTRKGVLRFHGLQARRLVEDAPFTSPSMASILTLGTYEMAMEAELDQAPPPTSSRESSAASGDEVVEKPDAGAGGSAAEAQGMVKELAGLIAGLQGHLDARLDKVDRSLAEHDARLGVIEKQLGK